MCRKQLKYVFAFFIFVSFVTGCFAAKNLESPKKVQSVLVLHSYHQGMQWTDSITNGIQNVLRPQEEQIDIFYEYLDSKRYWDSSYTEQKKIFYRKYKNRRSFDVIICVDDNALDFLMQNRDSLFEKIPVVFCGINQPLTDKILTDSLVTGVQEIPAIEETFYLVQRLHPKAQKIYIVNDIYSATAKINRRVTAKLQDAFPEQVAYLDTLSSQELGKQLAAIPKEDVILLLTFNQDKNKNFISYKEERRIVLDNAKAPVYAVWDFFLGKGVVGGKLTQGKKQGVMAAKLAAAILKGSPMKELPISQEPQASYVFDYEQLKRFDISMDALPAGSTFVNKPAQLYKLNKAEFFWALGIFIFLLALVFVLVNLVRKKKEAEIALLNKHKYLKMTLAQHNLISNIVTYLNSTNDLALVIDDVLNNITDTSHADKAFIFSLAEDNVIDETIGLRFSVAGTSMRDRQREDWNFHLHRQLRLVLDKKTVVSNDLRTFSAKEQEFFVTEKIGSVMLLPVEVKSKVNAVAGFAFTQAHSWTPAEMRLFSTLARVIANAWERNFQMNQYFTIEKQHSEAVHVMERTSRLASIGVLAAGITHEINQPLNAMKINTSMLLRQQKQKDEKTPLLKKLKAINKGINRIDQIILQMKEFWVRPVQAEEEEIWVDLNKALQRSCVLVERHLTKESVNLKMQLASPQLLIKGNKIQVEQIIINLLMNAIYAVKQSGKENRVILVKTFKQWDSAQLIIEDNGTGIDEKIGERLFDPLFSTKKNEEGSGLGLAIVKTFVARMNGAIRYENIYGGGVRFIVDFKALENERISITPDF